MSIACLLVIAGRAEAPSTLVKARAVMDEKCMVVVVDRLKVGGFERGSVDVGHLTECAVRLKTV